MKLKPLLIAVGCLAALSVIVFVLTRPEPPPSADPRIGRPLAEPGVIEQAARLRLTGSGKTVELAKSGNAWLVASYHDLPADFGKLSRFSDDLAKARLERLVTANPERIARLEFGDTVVSLLDAGGQTLWSATLGRNAESGGRFVRFGDEQKAFLTRFTAWLDFESKNWADNSLSSLRSDDVARIEIGFPEGEPLILARAKKEDPFAAANPPEGRTLDPSKVNLLLGNLTSLRFSETSAPDDPAAATARQHARTLKLTTFDQRTLTVTLGRKPEEKIYKTPAPTGPAAVVETEAETLPAGPVFAFVTDSDPQAPVNALMQKRAFQIGDYTFTSLPQTRDELFTAPPAP